MPPGPKKRRAQKKKKEAAAERGKIENEAQPTVISEENSPVMQTESTDGVTAVFDEPSVVLPKRTVLPEKMLAYEALDLKRKDTREGIKENALPTEISSSVQSLNVAAPLETSYADKLVVSSVVAAPCVIQLDSKDKYGGSIMSTDACNFEATETKDTIEYHVSSETYSSALVSEFHDATENLQDDDGSLAVAPDAAFSVMMDKAVESSITEPCDLNLKSAESSYAENAVSIKVNVAEDSDLEHKEDNNLLKKQDLDMVFTAENRVALEDEEIAVLKEDDAPGKTEEAFLGDEVEDLKSAESSNAENEVSINVDVAEDSALEHKEDNNLLNKQVKLRKTEEAFLADEVEAAVQHKENAISEDFSEIEKNALKAVAENQVSAAENELDAPEKAGKAVQILEEEAASENPEDSFSEDANGSNKSTLEAVAEDQITAALNEVDSPEKTEETVPVDEVETAIAAKPAVYYQIHEAVPTELVSPEVGEHIKEIKEMVEDVLNRLNAVGALLHRN